MEIKTPSDQKISDAQDLKIRPAFSFYSRSKNLQDHVESIQEMLGRVLPTPLPFSDKESLERWVENSLPWVAWGEIDSPPDCFSLFFLIKPVSLMETETFISGMIKRWLLPQEETTVLSFEHMLILFELYPNQTFFIGEAKILIKSKKQADLLQENLKLFNKEIRSALDSGLYAKSLLETKILPLDHKMNLIHESLIKLIKRFPDDLDEMLFHRLAMIQSLTTSEFREQRSYSHLARLVVSQVLTMDQLSRELNIFPEKRHMKIHFMPTELSFPFGVKSVLGLSIGMNFFHKYEFFDEKHVLRAAEKFVPNIRIVSASFYRFSSPNNPITTFYVELGKEDGLPFTLDEKKTLRKNLEEELKKRIEHLVPSLFMVRNEEETMRNILILSRELKSYNDMPQMMVSFDQHSQDDLIFTIVLLRIKKEESSLLQDLLRDVDDRVQFIPDRIQVVSYLDSQHPIEANVFRLQITKLPAFLRMDFSVNLYLARQEVVSFLTEHMGEIRDYNGGMMLKQGERLSQFKRLFHDSSKPNLELLENFFYSLNPIEAQATISLQLLSLFFELFLKVVAVDFPEKKSYVADFKKDDDTIIGVVRAKDLEYRTDVEEALDQAQIHHRSLISSTLTFEGNHYLSYLYKQSDKNKRDLFQEVIMKALDGWQTDKDKLQVLKLPWNVLVSLDPRIGGDQESSELVKLLFDGLMRIGSDGKPECSIAESYTVSEDKKHYVFKIRESYWSNGSRVIAYDFEYAWKKVLSPGFSTPFAYVFNPIRNAREAKLGDLSLDEVGVKAIDEGTLVVDLEIQAPYFLELTANTLYSPVNHLIDKIHPNWATQKSEDFVCNGPFYQRSQSSNSVYDFAKNRRHWNAKNVKIDRVLFTQVKGKPALDMLRNDQLHCLGNRLLTINDIKEEDLIGKASFYPQLKISWQCFNVKHFPFNNHKIRLAFSMAINRKEIIQIFSLPKKRQPAYTPLPNLLTQHLDSESLIREDEELAKETFQEGLKELGIRVDDFPIIYLSTSVQDQRVSAIFKSQWERVFGVRCEVEVSLWSDHFKKMTTGAYQIGGMNWTSWVNDPIYTLQSFKYSDEKVNFTGWESPEFAELLDLSDQTIDQERRKKYLADAEERLIRAAVVIPICYNMGWYIKHRNLVLNPGASNGNVDFSQAYFQ
ncbi:MAG: Oligopeptide-binding protein OppA [Chlamydiae bacterium]|nr:Oligopeptide-binding protein OppA [Chlamydiota bacterium]